MENAETVKDHFKNLYNIKSYPYPTVFDQVKQRPIQLDLDALPSLEELRKNLNSAKKDKAIGESKIHVEFWQILFEDECTESFFNEIVVKVWESGKSEEEGCLIN